MLSICFSILQIKKSKLRDTWVSGFELRFEFQFWIYFQHILFSTAVSNIPKCSQLLCFSIYIFPLQMDGNMDSYTCINTQWFTMQVPRLTTLPIISWWITPTYGSKPRAAHSWWKPEALAFAPHTQSDSLTPRVPQWQCHGLGRLWALQLPPSLGIKGVVRQCLVKASTAHVLCYWKGWWWWWWWFKARLGQVKGQLVQCRPHFSVINYWIPPL